MNVKSSTASESVSEQPDELEQFDQATYVAALAFNSVALPPNMPDFLKEAILARAEQQRETAGDFVIDNRGNTNDAKSRQEREEEASDFISQWVQNAQQQQAEREHEREWMQSPHTYAGQTMDAAQWKQMMEWFADQNVAQWEDAMMAETGQSREEVRQTGGKMKRFYDLMDKDAKDTLTKEESAEFKQLNDDSDVKRGVEVQQEIQSLQNSPKAHLADRNEATLDGHQAASAVSFAAALDDSSPSKAGLAAVPALSPTYREAAIGSHGPAARPTLAPAQTIQVSPDNMFG